MTGNMVHSLPARCRAAGLDVPTAAAVEFARAVAHLGPRNPGDLYWAGRCTLVRRPEDIAAYHEALAAALADADPEAEIPEPTVIAQAEAEADMLFSDTEVLRHTDLAALDRDDLDALLAGLEVRRSLRRSRRRHPGGRGPLDLRRTVRRSVRTQGETLELVCAVRRDRPRRLVVLLDVSGSMEPYAGALLRFAHRLRRDQPGVEVFSLGTRLTRLTPALADHDPHAALSAAGQEVPDWAGGTRLGASLRRFNDEWGARARGATVVVLSDGWDRGEPEVLGAEMARLHRLAYRLVWVNPLKATDGYSPVARGMAAALPHVDEFLSGHSVAALEELVEAIAR